MTQLSCIGCFHSPSQIATFCSNFFFHYGVYKYRCFPTLFQNLKGIGPNIPIGSICMVHFNLHQLEFWWVSIFHVGKYMQKNPMARLESWENYPAIWEPTFPPSKRLTWSYSLKPFRRRSTCADPWEDSGSCCCWSPSGWLQPPNGSDKHPKGIAIFVWKMHLPNYHFFGYLYIFLVSMFDCQGVGPG